MECFYFIIFISLSFSYALYHAARKNLSGVKQSVIEEWLKSNFSSGQPKQPLFPSKEDAQNFLGTLDCSFMVVYAMVKFFNKLFITIKIFQGSIFLGLVWRSHKSKKCCCIWYDWLGRYGKYLLGFFFIGMKERG